MKNLYISPGNKLPFTTIRSGDVNDIDGNTDAAFKDLELRIPAQEGGQILYEQGCSLLLLRKFRKFVNNIVVLDMSVSLSASVPASPEILTLPTGFRPATNFFFVAYYSPSTGISIPVRAYITTAGKVALYYKANGAVSTLPDTTQFIAGYVELQAFFVITP